MTRLLSGPWGLLLGPVCALIGTVGLLLADAETGLVPLATLRDAVQTERDRVDDLRMERRELVQKVRALRTDPFAIETVAREQLGMVRPGELVIRWE